MTYNTRTRAKAFTAPAKPVPAPTDGRVPCPMCRKPVKLREGGKTFQHKTPGGNRCSGHVFLRVDNASAA